MENIGGKIEVLPLDTVGDVEEKTASRIRCLQIVTKGNSGTFGNSQTGSVLCLLDIEILDFLV